MAKEKTDNTDSQIVSNGGVRDRNIVDEMRKNYIDYSMSVIVARALPDVRDGLKPVQRRILYVMDQVLHIRYNTKHKKSAQTVGEVLGKYHPHGDVAVYDAMVRMAQDFSMRYPLVDGQGNFGCFTKDTKVKLTDGRSMSFEELVNEHGQGKRNWTFAYNAKTNKIEIAEIKNPRLTRKDATLVEVSLDNGIKIRCTPNHRFMLRDGSYTFAEDLKPKDSLMPVYTKIYDGTEDKNLKGYQTIKQPNQNKWEFIHHLSDAWNLNNEIYLKEQGRVRHHIDFNKLNNNPTNILRMDWKEHWLLHARLASWRHQNDKEYVKKIAEGRMKYINEHKDILSIRTSARNKTAWKNKDFRSKMSSKLKSLWEDENYRKDRIEQSSKNLKQLWKKTEFRALMSNLKSKEMEERWKDDGYRNEMAKVTKRMSINLWKKPEHREYISKISKIRTSDPEWKKKQSDISKKLWQTKEYREKFSENHFSNMAHTLWADEKKTKKIRQRSKEQWRDETYKTKMSDAIKDSNSRRLQKNPNMMFELAEKAKVALRKKWQDPEYKKQVIKNRIMKFMSSLLVKYDKVTPEIFIEERKNTNIPNLDKIYEYFSTFNDIVKESKTYNHKVVMVRALPYTEDVYDLTIDNLHNFALDAGIFVHNSVDGDSAAHMRYTESRLSKIADELTKDIERDTVTFVDNYDGTTQEPEVLPSILPNLLINGAEGIAVGMATKIPPHNLDEITTSMIQMIDKHVETIDMKTLDLTQLVVAGFESSVTTEELMKIVKGPDFPTGAAIYDKKEIQNIYALGKGKALMRAVAKIEETKNGKYQIIVTELPYQVNKARLIGKIAELVKNGKLEGIADIRDESARGEIRVVIEIKREGNPNIILNLLYKYTEMQSTFNANMLALVDGEPQVLTLKNILELFITHRQIVVIRRTEYDLRVAKARAHILEGLLIALDHLDEVITTIRESPDQETAKTNLISKFALDDLQATAILDMQLRRLAALERQKIQDEYKEIMKQIEAWEALLRNPVKILQTIKDEFVALKEAYPSPRRTKVVAGRPGEFSEEDLIQSENVIIALSQSGYIKRMPMDTYKTQNRGGKGVIGMTTKETDVVAHIVKANTHDDILFFTNKGRVFQVKVYDIPEFSRTAKGQAVINIIGIESGELVTTILTKSKEGYVEDEDEIQEGEEVSEKHGEDYKYLLMATKNGTVKKTPIPEYEGIRKNGVIGIRLEKDDELVWVKPTTGKSEILMVTSNAQSIKFKETDVNETGRASMGVRGIKIHGGKGRVIGMDVVRKNEAFALVVNAKGYGKMTKLTEYPIQGRGGQGILTSRITDKTGEVVSMRIMDHPEKELLLVSKKGQTIRMMVKDVPVLGRQTSGVRLIKLDNDDEVAEVTCL